MIDLHRMENEQKFFDKIDLKLKLYCSDRTEQNIINHLINKEVLIILQNIETLDF